MRLQIAAAAAAAAGVAASSSSSRLILGTRSNAKAVAEQIGAQLKAGSQMYWINVTFLHINHLYRLFRSGCSPLQFHQRFDIIRFK